MNTTTSDECFFKIGNHMCDDHCYINDQGVRTRKQYESFMLLKSDILFLFYNPFSQLLLNEKSNRTMSVKYFDHYGYLVMLQITPTGIVKNKSVSALKMQDNLELVKQKIDYLKSKNHV